MFSKKTIKDINLKGKTVLVRADYNVPVNEEGKVLDEYRIRRSIPTLKYLLDQNCKIIICSHLGRPEGHKLKACFSLLHVAKVLSKELNHPVEFVPDCVGPVVQKAAQKLKNGQVMLMENLRCHPEEEANDKTFAKQLAQDTGAEVFVQDGFGVVHRAHASTHAITKVLPSVAGLLLKNEVDTITDVMHNPKRPLMAIVGGAKISDKIDVLETFIKTADIVAVGGAMANTFLLAKGIEVGESKVDKHDLDLAREIIATAQVENKKRRFVFYIPQDGVVATSIGTHAKTRIVDWDAHIVADIKHHPLRPPKESTGVAKHEMILDIGPFSAAFIAGAMQMSKMVIWNGPLGVTETPAVHGPVGPFAHGTETVMESMLGQFGNKPFGVIGGGDTAGYVEERDLTECFDHVSTGGGAGLELMAGKKLPGVEALEDK